MPKNTGYVGGGTNRPKGPTHDNPTVLPNSYRDSPTKTPEARVLSALYLLGLSASLLPVFGSTSLRASSRNFSKRGVPSRPPPRTPCGGRGKSVLAQVQGNHSPKKRPPLFLTFDLCSDPPPPHQARRK